MRETGQVRLDTQGRGGGDTPRRTRRTWRCTSACALSGLKTTAPLPDMQDCVQVLFDAQGRGGKNKAVDLEDMKFHQCVRLARFENDRTISFIPPDGAFDLMCALPPLPGVHERGSKQAPVVAGCHPSVCVCAHPLRPLLSLLLHRPTLVQ